VIRRWLVPTFSLVSLAISMLADSREQPVGLVLSAGGSKLRRADTETPIASRAGDLLFSGDTLKTEAGSASFVFCPTKTIETMAPSSEVHMEATKPKVKVGKLSEQPARTCILPQTLRIAIASQQHYGVTMTRGTNQTTTPPIPRDKLPADVVAELVAIDPQYAVSEDPAVRIAATTVFEKHDLIANALEIYYKLRELWPEAVWVKSKIFDLEQLLATRAVAAETTKAGGQTYALLVGISKYKRPELSLQFADADASAFSKLLASPRGGGIDSRNIVLLTDENATTAAVRNAFQDFLKRRAHKNDAVILVIAGHGTVEVPGSKNAFVLTYDSDPQDLASTALPMSELRALFEEQLKNVGRVLLFVDICKAGTIGSIQNTTVNADVQHLGDVDGDLFGFLASRPKEVSVEGPQFGGGHGVFSYFVLKGLGGAADANKDGTVDANELIQYVSSEVASATANRQHPREFGTYDNGLKLSDVTKPGIDISYWDSARGSYFASLAAPYFIPQASDVAESVTAAIQAGRLLPSDSNNALDALRRAQPQISPDRYRELVNQLRIALENRAQAVLLRYLAGDQNPQDRLEFAQGARYMDAARTLTRESLFLEGREDFFQGRALLFDKQFPDAANLLEQSVRIDPGAAYAYNALGIAYLEQGQFDKAIPAFRDAFKRAQHWSYPLHNEALAHVETGDYQVAIRLYQQAMRLTPAYSYLPYNLGLIYQRINRRKDAEASYRKAMSLAPDSAEPYNALGTLRAAEGKRPDAEKLYRDALQHNPDLLAARNNLATLLTAEKDRREEASDLFRENLRRSPDYLPSRLGLAQTRAEADDRAGAIAEYRRVLTLKPGYLAARVALADLLAKSGDSAAALVELREALKTDPENSAVFEQIGDISAPQNPGEAIAAYTSALKNAPDRSFKKRVEGKRKLLSNKPAR
jgi:tetratricopeptide (TPR) repeat protein